nr:threonine/serine exporter family protein [uncultured Selenomonas sp.]
MVFVSAACSTIPLGCTGDLCIRTFCRGLFKVFSVWQRCPITIFLSTSIFPLMPGLSFYRAVYFLMTGSDALAYTYMRSCFLSAFAIAIAISIVQQIPLRIRMPLRHRG